MGKEKTVKENGKLIHDLIAEVIDQTGPRLPGSDEEKLGAQVVAKQMERETGCKAVVEKFKMAPHASIGGIPILGVLASISFFLLYLSPIASLILGTGLFMFAILQIFSYTGVFDFMFPKKDSHNVYATLEPESNKTDYTIMFSGHIDSSWNWNHSLKNPNTMIIKTILGVVSTLAIAVLSLILVAKGAYSYKMLALLATSTTKDIGMIVLYCLPVLCVPGCYWMSTFLSYDKKMAAPGAMDNLSGVELGVALVKYYKENPDKAPANCRFICAGLGSEEAGLKGSMAFVKAHKNDLDLMNENLYVVNLDSFRDDEHFNVVKGDVWLFSHFDQTLINSSVEAMKEAGIKNPSIIVNPIGGCDSTPFARAGIKTVTLNAQNPTATNYYHTKNDTVEGLSMYSLEKSFETVINLVPMIEKSRKAQ